MTPLIAAVGKGHSSVVQLLLESGASVDLGDDAGTTPLISATESGHDAVVELLVEEGASMDFHDKDGITRSRSS
ncbi:hypothetical protein G195_011155 [Phytophthora kernoviae 00238/432]|uniref:Ankyrin n=1 Tax=Phytophthora kernoviae 00238/432 TaxID=1284355 RepID=A0A8J4S192_9STRA|nr:hypothetical protein G195_011155 [Phytophthora kernoviae 00238/432]